MKFRLKIWLHAGSLLLTSQLFSQQDNWDVYMARYEKGPGTTVVNMTIRKTAPAVNFPFLFSAGVKFTNCTNDGLPVATEFDNLNRISDSIISAVNRLVKNILVGTFTYQCERRDYFYVPDTIGLRQQIIDVLSKNFPNYIPAFNVKPDKDWAAYLEFLYPNEETMNYMQNEKVLIQLQKAGDKLEKERQVDHWIYFKTEADRECFLLRAIQDHFKVESKTTEVALPLPFKLQISRIDKIDQQTINAITLQLRQEAKKCNGEYDGWETFVIK
ncbi:MAG: DUF695 domain-containing protein [Bacteroidetes bacterium]|nr:MAG: DUF695 domain-containing protein [Bacteroidota bacterium]